MNPQRGHYHFMKIAEGYNETAKESKEKLRIQGKYEWVLFIWNKYDVIT